MARLIPNDNTWVGFATTIAATDLVPTAAEIAAAVNLTHFLVSLNASASGNTVPTPAFDTLFETSIPGTVQGTATGDFYRDDVTDTAWTTLPRATNGFLIVSRFGGAGTGNRPIAADTVEVWPVRVISRTMANMANNTVMTFTASFSIPVQPNESAIVAV
jgi:hypothetical protein